MRVLVNGATGKMGQEVCKAIADSPEYTLVGGVNVSGRALPGVEIFTDLSQALDVTQAQVVVDFTTPDAVQKNMEVCFAAKVPMVIGTTGFSETDLAKWQERTKATKWKAIIAPNFAIGAILLMKFSQEAMGYFQGAEIIEYHHAQKLDAPSGTALRTQALMAKEHTKPIPIHSVRLPGLVAHQEVIFGLPGQTLTIRHDSTNRESFMPGVLLAISKIPEIEGVVLGLEHILFTDI
jgi:4-hydroxy-tetrahydrodipicolinate reductase